MAKVLLVNNDSDTWEQLVGTSQACGFDVDTLHCLEVTADSGDGYDIVILSGGWWYNEAARHTEVYKGELELIRKTSTPVLGICIGMQLMQIAYSGAVPLLDKPQKDLQMITINSTGQELLDLPVTLAVQKNHTMGIIKVANGFTELAYSPGHVEIIRHNSRPLLGVQFHPEVGTPQDRSLLLALLVNATIRLKPQQFAATNRPVSHV